MRGRKNIMQRSECIELIQSFINERLDGNINNFYDYDLDQLENDKIYGAYDPDNSRIANAIYVVLWGDIVPDLTFKNLGTGELYRGDTMNSFNTLMGKPNETNTGFMGIQKYTNDLEIYKLAQTFHKKYHTIGNMIILPNQTLPADNTTINMLRGGAEWYDYYDLFLSDIRCILTGTGKFTSELSEKLLSLVNINSNFFTHFKGMDGFESFCNTFYLDKYINPKSFDVLSTFAPHARHWGIRYSETDYKKHVISYIKKATEIIDYRCSRMIEALEKEITQYDPSYTIAPKQNNEQSSKKKNCFEKCWKSLNKNIKLHNFIMAYSKSPLESISYFLAFFSKIFTVVFGLAMLIRHQKDINSNSDEVFASSIIVVGIMILCSLITLYISYIVNHDKILRMLMIVSNIIAFPSLALIIAVTAASKIYDAIWYNLYYIALLLHASRLNPFSRQLYKDVSIDINALSVVRGFLIILIVSISIPIILIIFDNKRRKYLWYSFTSCFTCLAEMLFLLPFFSLNIEVFAAIIILSILSSYFVFRYIKRGYKRLCLTCYRMFATKKIKTIHISSQEIRVNVDGNLIPGTKNRYKETHLCKFCDSISIKVTEEIVSMKVYDKADCL